jgi:hypothetical protein
MRRGGIMKREQPGPEDARKRELDDESEHEKNRRIKREQERILRKQLCHLRPAVPDETDADAARMRRFEE